MPSLNPNKKKLISIYRESLKTTVLLGFVTWVFCWATHKKQAININYNTATQPNAVNFMEDFRHTLLNCPLLPFMFEGIPTSEKGYKHWTKQKVQLDFVKFECSSFEEQQASRHHNIIINDDLVNEINSKTETLREDAKRKWKFQKSVSSQIKPGSLHFEIDVGTPYHYQDLMWELIKRSKTYDKLIISCVEGWPKVSIADVLNRTKPLSNPEIMTYEKLYEKLDEQRNSIFSSQYLLKPLSEQDALCREEWLKYYTRIPDCYYRTLVIDPGGAEMKKNDATGITIVDTDEFGNMYIVYADELWLSPNNLIDKIIELKKSYNPDDIRIEKEKYSITIADMLEHRFPLMNVSFICHEKRNKESRIWRLQQWFEGGRVFINENHKAFIDQLLQYPESSRDDILDSLSYQLDIRRMPVREERPSFIPEIEPTFDKEFDEYMRAINMGKEQGYYDRAY